MKRLSFLWIGLLFFGALHARTLTLDAALSQALRTHPDVKSALLQIRQSAQGTRAEESAWFPQVSIFAEYDPQRTYTMPMNGRLGVIDDDGWTAGVSVRQQLFDFLRTRYRVDAARIREQISALSAEDAKALLRYQVRNAYAQILVQQAALRTRRQDLAAKKAMLDQARGLYKQGIKTQADVLRFRSAMELARSDLAMAQAALERAIASLEQLIGRPIPRATRFQSAILYRGSFPLGKAAEKRLLEKNLGIRVARKNRQSSTALYEASRRERLGSIELVGDLSHLDTLSKYDSKTLGIRYSAPIFQGGRLGARSEQARIDTMIQAQRIEAQKRKILEEYRGLAADWRALARSIRAQKARIRSSEANKKLVEARYKEGLATYIDVLDAQATLLDARLGLLNAWFQRRNTLNRLEYLYGK